MRSVGVVTVGRSDYGIYRPILNAIQQSNDLELMLFVTGAHTSPEFGRTIDEIKSEGFVPTEVVEMLLSNDSPAAIATSMGLGTVGFAAAFSRNCPDILVVLGDRFEMHAAAVAAVPFKIPIAHIHGGEVSSGAIDEAFRHAITKYSHLHFASTNEHRERVIQLGEAPWRVEVSGAPSLDNLLQMQLLTQAELEDRVGISLDGAPLMVTYHPVTYQFESTSERFAQLVSALEHYDGSIVLTKPNADTNGRVIVELAEALATRHPNLAVVDNLGTQAYFSLMKHAAAMVGNSSSGIIEAASFELPVVNIGARQQGRTQSGNVLNVAEESSAIQAAITRAVSDEFRASLVGIRNIYGDGQATGRIIGRLKTETLDERLIMKQFHDISFQQVVKDAA
jgi:UDP-hydrolysing UDP-N-acetyl-D-glucosamine 2-epimerase